MSKEKFLEKMGAMEHDRVIDKSYGKKGTKTRDEFEEGLNLEIVGEILKKIRKEKKLTQEQVAEGMGVKKAFISKIENNVRVQRIDTVIKFLMAVDPNIEIKISSPKQEYKMKF